MIAKAATPAASDEESGRSAYVYRRPSTQQQAEVPPNTNIIESMYHRFGSLQN
jgi:hypothetical protein